jgi:hypothetical protein
MNWINIIRGLIVSLGNPVAFLAMMISQIPGTIIGGHYFRVSLFGIVVCIAFGYLYLGLCAIIRKFIWRKNNILGYFEQISIFMLPLSALGLILPFYSLTEMEGNVFGFIILPIILIFTLIWISVSLYAIWKK